MMQVRWSLTPTSAQKKRGGSSKDLTELDGSSSRVQQISAMGPGVANSSAADALDQQWARRMPSYDAGAIADELTAALSRSCASDTDGHSESGSSPLHAKGAKGNQRPPRQCCPLSCAGRQDRAQHTWCNRDRRARRLGAPIHAPPMFGPWQRHSRRG